MRRSLRARLLAIILIGIMLLALLGLLLTTWQLFRVRDSAISDSSRGLEDQARSYLLNLAQLRAESTGQALANVRQVAEIVRDVLAEGTLPQQDQPLDFQDFPPAWRYAHGATTLLIPGAGADKDHLADLKLSQVLDSLLPGQARRVPEVVRISFLTPQGVIRTYPRLEPSALAPGWSVLGDPIYQLSLPNNNLLRTTKWSEIHGALDGSEEVISAVTPVYQQERFVGTIIVDVSLGHVTAYLDRLRIQKTGFAFLLDTQQRLVAAPETGQLLLLGHADRLSERSKALLDPRLPGLEPVLLEISRGQSGVGAVTLDGRGYLMAYAPIQSISWSQVLAVPLEEITETTKQTTERIAGIARETQLFGSIASILVGCLIALLISLLLRRQFMRPLGSLIDATKAVAGGDLQLIVNPHEDEIGQLAFSFNAMTRSLQASRNEILTANQYLEQTVRDRTRDLRKALETAEEANKLKTQFVANMSHELRTPLNAIINFTQFLDEPEICGAQLTETQRNYQQRVIASSEHLLGLINDILDLAKIESGHMKLHLDEVVLPPLLEGVMATAIGLTKDKGLRLSLDIAEDLPHVWGDKTRIRQVMLNLLSNAAKFTMQGSITVRALATEQGFVQISVKDTGIGIAPEQQHLVFEEFRQVDGDLTRQYSGTGLGMPITKRLLVMQGGTIWLESEPGVGTTFSFTLPIMGYAAQQTSSPAPAQTLEPAGAAAVDVLVVDDDEQSQAIFKLHLESQGYRVQSVLDPREAVQTIIQLRPRLVILDVIMPSLDGWKILGLLKDNPATATIPVVLCSMLDDRWMGLTLGASDYLVKPIRESTLLPIVQRYVQPNATVLVIDDDPDARAVFQGLLGGAGYTVIEARDGREGQRHLQSTLPDLVLLDLSMPELDGFAVLEWARSDARYQHLPIVIVSALDLSREEQAWLRERSEHYFHKNALSQAEFLDYISLMLGGNVQHS